MSVVSSLRRLFDKAGTRPFAADQYWEERHQSFRGCLKAVASLRLTEAHNEEQYAVKRIHIGRAIHRHVPDAGGKALLEAGCGIGLMTPAYVQLGFDVVAVDFSPTALEEASKRAVHAQFVRSRLAELELNRTFDVITVIDVLLHIVDDDEWVATLEVLARHLTPTGVMIVLDWIGDWVGPLGDHCKIRPMSRHVAALADVGLRIDATEQFSLEHEDVRKDLLTIRRARD